MSKKMVYLAALIGTLAFLTGTALAGTNSYGIMVSCTIPAIPGVNVPLVEEQSTVTVNQVVSNNAAEQQIQEEAQIEKEQTVPSTQEGSFVIAKTIYSR